MVLSVCLTIYHKIRKMDVYNNNQEYYKTITFYDQCLETAHSVDMTNVLLIEACSNIRNYDNGK